MKSTRKTRFPATGRITPPLGTESGSPAPVHGSEAKPATESIVYIGETKGPKPTKYFVTFTFEIPDRLG